MSKDKKITLECLESKDISDILSTEESNNRIHVLPMMKITLKVVSQFSSFLYEELTFCLGNE